MDVEPSSIEGMMGSDRLDAKSATDGLPGSIWETYSAFANTSGGTILLGVSEDAATKRLHVTGVQDPKAVVDQFWDAIGERVSAILPMEEDVRVMDVDGLSAIAIRVPRADRSTRPIFIDGDLSDGTYRRNGEGDYRCTMEEVKEMIRDSGDVSADGVVVEDLGVGALDQDTVNRYRSLVRTYRPDHPWLQLDGTGFLEVVGAVAVGRDGGMHPTGAGLLMFGKERYITREFPNYLLDYRETTPGGPRWSYRLLSQTGEWSGNVFDFLSMVSPRLSLIIGSEFRMDGSYRMDRSESALAVREALINALIHADYYGRQGVIVEADRHRVTVSNPGTFRIPMSKAIRGGESDPRNSGLMRMALIAGIVEHIGSGVREMEDAARSGALVDLGMEESFDPSRVKVTLDLEAADGGLTKDEAGILDLIEEDPGITIAEMARRSGTSTSTVNRILGGLRSRGIVSRSGGARGGHWVLRRRSPRLGTGGTPVMRQPSGMAHAIHRALTGALPEHDPRDGSIPMALRTMAASLSMEAGLYDYSSSFDQLQKTTSVVPSSHGGRQS